LAADSVSESRHQSKDEDESVRHLVELGYLDPDEVAAWEAVRRQQLQAQLSEAIELNRQGRGPQAAALLVETIGSDPDWSPPHQLLAEIYYQAGRWSDTQAELEWLADHGLDTPQLALIAAGIALARREMNTSLQELEYARRVEPELPSLNTLLGTVLFRLARLDEAEDAFREASQQNPADARARDGLAAIYLKHGEFEDAADWALRAVEQDMQLFRAHCHLGMALVQLGSPEEAIAALETAARVDPTRAAPYYWMSRISEEQLKDSARAARYHEQAREIIRQRRRRR
jgi:tetratricopeptide (TPR) repeat protein